VSTCGQRWQVSFVQVNEILEALNGAMSGYCLNKGLLPRCLLIPEMAFAPFTGALVWSVILVVSALLLLQGAISGTRDLVDLESYASEVHHDTAAA
jgi:hypothetical protein